MKPSEISTFQSQNGLILVQVIYPFINLTSIFQSQNGLILVICVRVPRSGGIVFQSQNGLILVWVIVISVILFYVFQSQNGLILVECKCHPSKMNNRISIPKWSDFSNSVCQVSACKTPTHFNPKMV